MNQPLVDQLLTEAAEACAGDEGKMAEWLAGVAAGAIDLAQGAVSFGFARLGEKVGATSREEE
jgi:hypothetical protein